MIDDAFAAEHRSRLYRQAETVAVPRHLRDGLVRYIVDGIRPGSFLCAVLANDLLSAVSLGDPESLAGLKPLMLFIVNEAPNSGVRSYENIAAFVKRRAAERAAVECDHADLDPAAPSTPDTSYLEVRHPNGAHR